MSDPNFHLSFETTITHLSSTVLPAPFETKSLIIRKLSVTSTSMMWIRSEQVFTRVTVHPQNSLTSTISIFLLEIYESSKIFISDSLFRKVQIIARLDQLIGINVVPQSLVVWIPVLTK